MAHNLVPMIFTPLKKKNPFSGKFSFQEFNNLYANIGVTIRVIKYKILTVKIISPHFYINNLYFI